MADSQHKYLLERGWSQQQIDEVIRKAHEWLRGAGYTPLTEQGHWNGIMGSTQSYHLPSREKDARGMTEAFVEMLKGGKILDASRVHKFSRPGEKEMMAREVVARKGSKRVELSGPNGNGQWVVTVMQEEKQVVPGEANDRFVESKWYSTEATARRAASKILASRPGAKAKFKVEDRFYFGKGRKERFADDAKQIAQTILAQLGGGRFVAMTGAKNLAFYNNPPGLRMSIGRGAKDAIKYLRVDYDRGSDTYTMIFSNKSGSTVKSVNHVYADSLQRVFTSTTGFDTHL
jgi:hypothetical protein